MNNAEVRNNRGEHRYEIRVYGQLAGYTHYMLRGDAIAFLHTEVHDSYEGMGSRLARAALEAARARDLVVMPYCRLIAGFIERHLDEYGDLVVAPEMPSGERP